MWFWFVLFIPYVIQWSLLNEIKLNYIEYNYILSIFKCIIWKLEIVENQPIWGILIKYCTCSSKQMNSWRCTFYHTNTNIKSQCKIYQSFRKFWLKLFGHSIPLLKTLIPDRQLLRPCLASFGLLNSSI